MTIFLHRFHFPEETRELAKKSPKHVLVKISSTKMSHNIYNIYNRYLRNDVRSMFREGEKSRAGTTILATFVAIIFFLVFYVNIQPSCSKTRMEYFNIKIRLLKISKCLIILFVVFSFFVTKRTQSNSEKTSIWSTPKLLRKSVIFYWFFFLFFDKFNRLIGFCCNANLAILTHFEDEKKKKNE